MNNKIPNNVIGAVSSVLGEHYFSHSTLNSLFMESGAPGEVPPETVKQNAAIGLKLAMKMTQ